MRGNFHAPFLGEGAIERSLLYPATRTRLVPPTYLSLDKAAAVDRYATFTE